MGQINTVRKVVQGPPTTLTNAHERLQQLTLSCLLWERQFYLDGVQHADLVAATVPQCDPEFVAQLARYAANEMNLRHIPLLLVAEMVKHPGHKALVGKLLPDVINRADSLTEFMAIYWRNGRTPVAAQVKKGLAAAFLKFSAYQLVKYDRPKEIKLRDVAFICHPKATGGVLSKVKERVYKNSARKHYIPRHLDTPIAQLINGTLPPAGTWEERLSAGEDAKSVFSDLLHKSELGALALLRNLRNMIKSNVDEQLIIAAINQMSVARIMPHQIYSAYIYAKGRIQIQAALDNKFIEAARNQPKLLGKTWVLVDVSGSMDEKLADRSERTRMDVAAALAVLTENVSEASRVFTFSTNVVDCGWHTAGLERMETIKNSQRHGGTDLRGAIQTLHMHAQTHDKPDRIIVITDEQSQTGIDHPLGKGYVINVAAYDNGLDLRGQWVRVNGWSDGVLRYITQLESK